MNVAVTGEVSNSISLGFALMMDIGDVPIIVQPDVISPNLYKKFEAVKDGDILTIEGTQQPRSNVVIPHKLISS